MSNNNYYFHNIKVDVQLTTTNKTDIDFLSVADDNFSFCENKNKYRFWPKTVYSPITVLRKGKPWANFDIQRLRVHIVTKGNFENQLNDFVSILKPYFPDLTIRDAKIKYIEICTRYPDKYFDSVGESIKKSEARFFTATHAEGIDRRIEGKTWLIMGRKLFIDKNFLNVKTYRFIENFSQKKRSISELVLPKIEVQIYKPQSLGEAKQEAVSIIKAFQEYIGFEAEKMYEPEYSLIQNASSLSHNKKLLNFLKDNIAIKAIRFSKEVTKDELTHKIACLITPEAKSSQEIMSYANISRSTLQRVLNKLKPYLEKRGNNAGIYYQIDTNLIEQTNVINKDKDSCITRDRVNSNAPKRNNILIVRKPNSKPYVYCQHIAWTKQRPRFHKVRIIAEKQIVKEHSVNITVQKKQKEDGK